MDYNIFSILWLTLSSSRYLLMQIPSNMLISSKHVRPSLYMAVCIMAWAVVSACTALARNYTDLVVVRFFLGVTEAPFYPGAICMLSIFYTRKEIATRLSILYSGNIFATSFSGLIAVAVFNTIDGNHGLRGWQWLFIIEGCLTFGVAIIGMFTLADNPLTTRWLKPRSASSLTTAWSGIPSASRRARAPGPASSRPSVTHDSGFSASSKICTSRLAPSTTSFPLLLDP